MPAVELRPGPCAPRTTSLRSPIAEPSIRTTSPS